MTTTTAAYPTVDLQYAAVFLIKHASATIIVTVATHLIVAVKTTMTKNTEVTLLKRHFTSTENSLRILSLKETSPLVSRTRKPLNLMLKWHDSMNGPLFLKTRTLIPVSVKGYNTRMQSTVSVRINTTKLKHITSRKGTCSPL